MALTILIIYALALLFIFVYSLMQLHLVYYYNKSHKQQSQDKNLDENIIINYPHVTIQLPVYNEMYVVERLIDSVCNFDYPKDKLEIQVLDDSTDETVEIIRNKVKDWQDKGMDIEQVLRPDREGYKAGALKYGLELAKGEFIAIFDSDFTPRPEFLLKTLPYFQDNKIGVVQTKWGHLNQDYSLLTKLQAFGLDAHFTVEQTGRNTGGFFINFNGTAGIWRKQCIIDAGNWQSDTLTEDLDLSYRAQLKGWKFKYMENFDSPAELPATMSALKTQQFRWTKGAAETASKHLGAIIKSSFPLKTKVHAFFHLFNSSIFMCVITIALLSVPILLIKHSYPEFKLYFNLASVFLFSLLVLGYFYWTSLKYRYDNNTSRFKNFAIKFPLFLSISMGISLNNAIAVLQGLFGIKTAFIRTPKFNIIGSSDSWKNNKYFNSQISIITVTEIIFTLYFLGGAILAFYLNDFGLFPFHIMLFVGYFLVSYYSIKQSLKT
ncbi:MAG: glycosyltransferase family 2 protein [Bacteroidia bacterium]|nr:glycosyltransferase family 2 protein [Bacteroidia bacterium]